MKSTSLKRICGVTVLALTASAASAQLITYVDVTSGAGGNTTLTNGTQWDPLADGAGQGTTGDGVWAVRDAANGGGFGNMGTIYQNTPSGTSDDAHPLLTSVNGLSLNTYDVYVYFWSDSSAWRIRAGFDLSSLSYFQYNPLSPGATVFATPNGTTIYSSSLSENPFTTDVMIAEGSNRRLIQGYVGQVTGTGISLFIDDGPATSSNERTWYDGIGYAVVPEPTSFSLLGVGVLLLVGARRRINL
jgi:hypothetical protein